MKKLLILLFLGIPFFAKSQLYFNGKSEEELKIKKYLVVSIYRRLFENSDKLKLEEGSSYARYFLTDKNGNDLTFDKSRDILDFLDENNWEYVSNLDVIEGNGRELVFKKRPIMTPPNNLK
ncbi:hypothetical protein SAMN06298216_0039 [Spirosomataceae bacterium TFI 002]|nr:hypothetical protein SAMN06298216_0039 [Spirosomataceae bacterium TFI 002]